ncbi:MAG: threonylcarbamoyl-AMP synthase [Verrucomicrobia bacterium]|mgnify:CR=1 FL=1|nr:threonylcarbamoyl-AMP synthase [Verrucomicrobiota bacterium]NMD21339.1 threonylcarbamoyl-AMP synthase [Verrucomicrobiota bacterium]OQC67406.1 MAG: Threonylcarbamoyl-AMP synthase [Verrucomicrobia bacterium ADurb.Bin006]HPV09725.1 L-threonylcarbamoyladenylate synthase [Verrucomicrobiota bacterium]
MRFSPKTRPPRDLRKTIRLEGPVTARNRHTSRAGPEFRRRRESHYHTEILATHTPALFAAAVDRASALLRAGEIVALPTETVYGLAANAYDKKAVARLFAAKGRPAHNPIIVHVANVAMARRCVASWPRAAQRLARAFWPGPLTLVLPKATTIPHIVTSGGATVGVRCPRHSFIRSVILECGFPLAAPSANRSTALSPTRAEHVRASLGGRIPLIVDGGPARVGIESTVVDLTARPLRVLRSGMIHRDALTAVLGVSGGEIRIDQTEGGEPVAGAPRRSPGQLARHYAPRTPLALLEWNDEADLRRQVRRLGWARRAVQILAHTNIPGREGWGGMGVIPRDPEGCAQALYAELHRCDQRGGAGIVIEAVPEDPRWEGIADRLRRASASRYT